MSRTLMVMAGGTGGHVFPGLAVADELRRRGWDVVWLGTRHGMEADLVPRHGIAMEWVSIAALRGKGLARKLLMPWLLALALGQSVRAIFRRRPDVVLGMGGFAAFPGALAAVLLRRPLAIHEQNAVAGLTNRVLAPLARCVMVAFPDPFAARRKDEGGGWKDEGGRMKDEGGGRGFLSAFIPHPSSLELVGNPVRAEIAALKAPEARFAGRAGPLRLLVIGGSLGAAALNDVVPQALARLPAASRPEVVHQAGKGKADEVAARYRELGVAAQVSPFLDDMAAHYARCDLVICRAGALTVSEIAAAGVAAILVPYPHAVDDHQTWNARFLADAGAAWLMPQLSLTPEHLAAHLETLERATLLARARAARALGKPDATRRAADLCAALAG